MLVVINIDSLMRGALCDKLHRPPSQLLFPQLQPSIDIQLLVQNRELCLPHVHLTPPLGWCCRNTRYCHNVWYRKTRMVWLPDSEKVLKICLFFLTEFTNVTDRQRDRHTDGRTPHDDIGCACMKHRAAKNCVTWAIRLLSRNKKSDVSELSNSIVDGALRWRHLNFKPIWWYHNMQANKLKLSNFNNSSVLIATDKNPHTG